MTWLDKLRTPKYQIAIRLLWPLLGLPVLLNLLLLVSYFVWFIGFGGLNALTLAVPWLGEPAWKAAATLLVLVGLLPFLFPLWLEFHHGRKWVAPTGQEHFFSRYFPFLIPLLYVWGMWALFGLLTSERDILLSCGAIAFLPFLLVAQFVSLIGANVIWIPLSISGVYLAAGAAFFVGVLKSSRPPARLDRRDRCLCALFAVFVAVSFGQAWLRYHSVLHYDPEYPALLTDDNTSIRLHYEPFTEESAQNLTPLRQPPALRFTDDYPRLDGATAFFPLYAAAAQAIYVPPEFEEEDREGRARFLEQVQCNTTSYAYQRLIDGETDLIFVFAPSKEQEAQAAAKGLRFTLTPLAREAFVFLVNAQNPVEDLSVERIRDIYSGQINNWKAVGGLPEKIIPFQREENSGSQTVMEKSVMRELALRKPLKEEVVSGMSGLIHTVADYRNYKNALGYSFRFYATKMNAAPGVKLLKINGIAPTVKNIRSGRYPLTETVYMVAIKDRPLSTHTQQLKDWFLSETGQQLVEDVGYVHLADG
jgi:phosphate transport system substrate-binding protein